MGVEDGDGREKTAGRTSLICVKVTARRRTEGEKEEPCQTTSFYALPLGPRSLTQTPTIKQPADPTQASREGPLSQTDHTQRSYPNPYPGEPLRCLLNEGVVGYGGEDGGGGRFTACPEDVVVYSPVREG